MNFPEYSTLAREPAATPDPAPAREEMVDEVQDKKMAERVSNLLQLTEFHAAPAATAASIIAVVAAVAAAIDLLGKWIAVAVALVAVIMLMAAARLSKLLRHAKAQCDTARVAATAAAARAALVRRQATELAAQRQHLLLNITHELNTPLHEVLGCLDELSLQLLPTPNHPAATLIATASAAARRAAHRLRAMLDASQFHASSPVIRWRTTALSSILTSLKALPWPPHRQLHTTPVPSSVDIINADNELIVQALYELTDNAFKFSEGDVYITVAPSLPDAATVAVTVSDGGCGISEADLPFVWQPFQQGAAGGDMHARPAEGLGLGLYLACAHRLRRPLNA
jgi:signal transduction histidine kinase